MTAPYFPPEDLVTTAVLDLLNGSGRKVWDGVYGGNATKPAYPYGIAYAIAGGSSDPFPTLDADPREATLVYQVTAVSNLRNQAQATARLFRDRVLGKTAGAWTHPLELPDGWQVIDRRPDEAMPGVDVTGSPPSVVYSAPFRFYITVAPL